MANLRKCSLSIAFFCFLFFANSLFDPVYGKAIEDRKLHHKRSPDTEEEAKPEVADVPSKVSVDDAQVKKYAQLAVDKFGSPSAADRKGYIKEINEATLYPPSGKLLYMIKLRVGLTKCKKDSDETNCEHESDDDPDNCEISVFRETDNEPSMSMKCWRVDRRKRAVEDQPPVPIPSNRPIIMDAPLKLDVNDERVKNFVELGLQKYAEDSKDSNPLVLEKIVEAYRYHPVGTIDYSVKILVRPCSKGTKENCEVKADGEPKQCTVRVFRGSNPPEVTIECDKSRRRRAAVGEPQIADLPTKTSVDDAQVKDYAQKGVEKMVQTSTGPSNPVLEKILEATFFPPAGKLLYEIKVKVTSKENKENSQDCTVNVWRESDAEPSVTVECGKSRRRRAAVGEPQIADLPTKTSVDDAQVKDYAQKGVEKMVQTSTGPSNPVLEKILEATFFPPAGKLLYEIKVKVASKENKDNSQDCTVNVWRESDAEPSVTVECGKSRRRRAADSEPDTDYIADLPVELDVTDPYVKKLSQRGLDEYAKRNPNSKTDLVEILQVLYVPLSSYSHQMKVKFGKRTCPEDKEEDCENVERVTEICTVNIPQNLEDDTVDIKCAKDERRKREAGDSSEESAVIGSFEGNKPLNISVDEPDVKKFAQKGVEMYAETSTGPNEPILEKIEEALLHPPSKSTLFVIKIRIGTSTCPKGQKENCELKADGESKPCTVNVLLENDKPRVELECNQP